MERLAMPNLMAQAASRSIGRPLIAHAGTGRSIAVLIGAAAVDILLLVPLVPRRPVLV